jgi:polyhydroxybutyrate depolymerase
VDQNESVKIDRSMKPLHPLLFVLCLHPVAEGKDLKPGTNRVEFMHDKELRQMLVRVPGDYDASRKYPVVFGFHGAGGPMEGYHRQLEGLVRNHGYISVSPQGLSNAKRNRRGVTAWNGFSNHRFSSSDDVGLVVKTVEYLDRNASIDRTRLYATGGSSGAIFCFRLAMETDLFAAIAPMRGAMINRPPLPRGRPRLSILLVCGAEDALFTGESKVPGEVFYPARKTMELWATNHGARTESAVLEKTGQITLTRYSPEKADYELLLYAVKGSGHRLSRVQMTTAIDYMAGFFSRHARLEPKAQ